MKPLGWTLPQIEYLQKEFPTKSTATVARALGISKKSVERMASKLRLEKDLCCKKRKAQDTDTDIIRFFPSCSYSEIALILGLSRAAVISRARRLGLKRDCEDRRAIRSRVRKSLVAAERRRALFGLEQKTRLKVVTNRKRVAMRKRLRRHGYLLARGSLSAAPPSPELRNISLETKANALGFIITEIL